MFIDLVQQQSFSTEDVPSELCSDLGPLCQRMLDWTGSETLAETVTWVIGTPLKVTIVVVLAVVVNRILRRAIRHLSERIGDAAATGDTPVSEGAVTRAERRASTIASLLRSVSSALVFAVAAVMIMEMVGISVLPVIASAGILGLAVGFGAQSIVSDLFAGIFMLSEDQFGVGDRIDIGTVNGIVEQLTLRTVVIRDADGTLWHVPNSKIAFVANENQSSSRAAVEIGISYSDDVEMAMEVLQRAAQAACDEPEWRHVVTRPTDVVGVQSLDEGAVVIRVQGWVTPERSRPFQRHLLLRLKQGLDAAGVEIRGRREDP